MDTMTDPHCSAAGAFFNFIGPAHAFYQQVQAFKKLIEASPAYCAFQTRRNNGLSTTIHAEIKTKCDRQGRHLERFYYSIQYPDHALPGGLFGWSVHYTRSEGAPKIYRFPEDPKLPHLQAFIESTGNQDVEVLRYVPLRRVTFRKARAGTIAPCIGKLKKPNRCLDGYRRLSGVASIAEKNRCTIPEPIDLDRTQSVFYQTLVPGKEAGLVLNRDNYRALMFEIGQLQYHIHQWPVAPDKPWDRNQVTANLWHDVDEIIFYLPNTETLLLKIKHWLKQQQGFLRVIPNTFCHGDFACSQILHHDKGWSVVDFDLAGEGHPYQDMAFFMASLYFDVEFFQKHSDFLPAAYDAFLAGYQKANDNSIDLDTFNWYWVGAEIYFLALALKKDRLNEQGLERTLTRLQALTHLN